MKNILLIGETGTGKSSLGNFLLGEDFFKVSDEPFSGTKKITGKQNEIDNIFVIDTPGYQDSDGDDRKNFKDILEYFCKKKNLELLLMTLNYKSPRIPFTIINLIKFLCHAFPKKLCNHIGFVFTHYDDEYENRKSVYEEDDYIITKINVYKRKKQIYYDGTVNYTNWKFSYSDKNKEKKEIEIEKKEEKQEKEEKKFGFIDGLLMIGGIAMIVYDYFSRKNKQNIKFPKKKF